MADASSILDEFRTSLAAIALTRDPAKTLKRYQAKEPFRTSPTSRADAFHVESRGYEPLGGFGVGGQKEGQLFVAVLLGHNPAGTEEQRETYAARDAERVTETLEKRAWTTPGISAVFLHQPTNLNRDNGDGWVTELVFRVVFTGDIP